MAIDNQFGKGIGLAAGFDLGAQKPLDSRVAVNTIEERDAHVTENRAFEGMIVFVDATKKNYQLVNGEWVELFLDEQTRLAALETQLNGGEGAEGNGVLAELQDDIDAVDARLNQGGDIEGRIAQNESDIDRIDGEIGQASVAANPEEGIEAVQATGLHKKIEDTAAEIRREIQGAIGSADNAVAGEKSRAEGEEARIEGKVDQEVLDRKAADEALGGRIDAANQALADQLNPDKDGSLQKQLNAEIARAQQAESDIQSALDAEEERAGLAEQGLQAAIDAINNADNGILAQAKALDKTDRDAQLLVDQEQDRRLGLLEAANAEGGAVANAIKEAKDAADAAQGDADALEQRLDNEGGLVDRIEANETFVAAQPAIDQEQDRRIKALEDANAEGGAVKEAIDAAQADVDAIEGRLDNEGGLVDRLEAVEQFVNDHDDTERDQKIADNKAAIDKLNGAADAEGSVAKAVKDAVDAEAGLREEADNDLSDRIAVFEANGAQDVAAKEVRLAAAEEDIARLDGAVDVEGSVKKQIKDAIDEVNGAAETLEGRVKANEDKLAGLEKDTVQAAINQAEADAKAHAEQKITELVDSAPDAMNTLNELAKAINDNKGIYDAWVIEHNQAMADMKKDLQDEIDADVKAEADRAKAEEADIRADFAAADTQLKTDLQAEIDADVKVEKERAEGQEAAIRGELEAAINKEVEDRNAAILVEKQRAEGQEAAIRQELANEKAALQAEIDADVKVVADELAKQKDAAQEGTLANQIKVEKERAIAKENEIAGNLAQELLDRDAADDALDERLQAVEASLGMGEGNEGTEGIASRVENLEEAIGKAAEGEEPATGLHLLIDNKIAEVNRDVQDAVSGLEGKVTDEETRAKAEEARIAGLVSTEETRAKGEEARIEGLVTAEADRAKAAEKANADAINALELALGEHLTAVSCGDDTTYTDLPNLTPPQA